MKLRGREGEGAEMPKLYASPHLLNLLSPSTSSFSFHLRCLYSAHERKFDDFIQFIKRYRAEQELAGFQFRYQLKAETLQLIETVFWQRVEPDLHRDLLG